MNSIQGIAAYFTIINDEKTNCYPVVSIESVAVEWATIFVRHHWALLQRAN